MGLHIKVYSTTKGNILLSHYDVTCIDLIKMAGRVIESPPNKGDSSRSQLLNHGDKKYSNHLIASSNQSTYLISAETIQLKTVAHTIVSSLSYPFANFTTISIQPHTHLIPTNNGRLSIQTSLHNQSTTTPKQGHQHPHPRPRQ